MGQNNRRREPRIVCDVPVRMLSETHADLEARVVDVSRTGVRIRIEGHLIGMHRLSSLATVAKTVTRILGDNIEAELNHEKIGPLLRRTMKAIRIAKRDWEHAYVELGCALQHALTDEEGQLLGVSLPPPVSASLQPETPGNLHLVTDTAGGRFQAHIHPGEGHDAPPLAADADVITSAMAMLKVPDPENHAFAQMDVASAIVALHEMYGPKVMVRLVEDEDEVWLGPAEITEVDVFQGERARAHLGIVFGRELGPAELSRLGLPTPA